MIYEYFLQYRDKYGLNQIKTENWIGEVSQNGTLATMEYLIVLLNDEDTSDKIKKTEIVRIKQVFESCEPLPGLSSRHPESFEIESMDNSTALLTFSALYGNREFAKRMLERGKNVVCTGIETERDDTKRIVMYYWLARLLNFFKKPKYYWNNTRPELFTFKGWFGRSPGFRGFLRHCATGEFGFLGGIWVFIGQFMGVFSPISDCDARKLPYVAWQYLKTINWFWALSYKVWCWILMRRCPNGMRDVYAYWYPDANQPIRIYSKTYVK